MELPPPVNSLPACTIEDLRTRRHPVSRQLKTKPPLVVRIGASLMQVDVAFFGDDVQQRATSTHLA
jgi:hypothetical protein